MSLRSRMYLGLLILATSIGGHAEVFGNWANGESDGTYWAITINDSENLLGLFCFTDENCLWLLGVDTACEEGSTNTYPVLVNSDTAAVSLSVYCFGKTPGANKSYRYAFSDFDAIDEIVRGGNRLGIAFPLQGDRFAVERFNLAGSVRALDAMLEEAAANGAGPTGTKSKIM